MRPPDENQDKRMHAHPRPNLMSSARRGGIEDSILAKLEREPARRGGGNGLRLAWYGTAGALAVTLTAVLAWLASGTGPAPQELARLETPSRPVAQARVTPPAPAPASEPIRAAVIVDSPSEFVPVTAAAPPPPLRLLEPAAARPAPLPAESASATRTVAPPRRFEARTTPPTRARAPASRPAVRQGARQARTVNPARPDTHDDSDVALISAVIFHANGHAAPEDGEPAAVPCADEACRTRQPRP